MLYVFILEKQTTSFLWFPCRCDGCGSTINQILNQGKEEVRRMD